MTLRSRLLLALVVLAASLGLSAAAVLALQQRYLVEQVDNRISALAVKPRAVVALAVRGNVNRVLPELLSDVYIGRMTADGRLRTVVAPTDDPDLVPQIAPGERIVEPVGRATSSGVAQRVRVVTAPIAGGGQVVIAAPTTRIDAVAGQLRKTVLLATLIVTLVAGLAAWWVVRLGLKPIAAMTRDADAITAGDRDRRVDPGPDGTEVARLGQAINAMVDQTQATQARMRQFIADASHELRTPLTTLLGYSSLYAAGQAPEAHRAGQRHPVTAEPATTEPGSANTAVVPHPSAPEIADAMRRINAEATRMSRIVESLQQLTSLDDPASIARHPVDLIPVLTDAVTDAQVVDPSRTVSLSAPARLVVIGDRDRLAQAVLALTSNALRHTPSSAALVMRGLLVGGLARVEVSDGGPGISAEQLPHLFERFYRVDKGRARSQGGSGLGLAIVAAIVSAHGGRYGADSLPGQGSTFWFEIPSAGADTPDPGSEPSATYPLTSRG